VANGGRARADEVESARAALRAGDVEGARQSLAEYSDCEQDAEALEYLARAAYMAHDFDAAVEQWKLAYALHREAEDYLGATRVARSLAPVYGTVYGDAAVMRGWLARAQTLLGTDDHSLEAGWVALSIGMFEGDRSKKDELFRTALAIARAQSDTDLEVSGLAYLGSSLVHADKIDDGMRMLDESLAAIVGNEVESYQVVEEAFCQLFAACEHAHDVVRADEWIRVGQEVAAARRLTTVAAFCHTHYGGLLTVAGRWDEADAALTEAVGLWDLGWRALRPSAITRLADLRVRQGRFAEAEQLLDGFAVNSETARALAEIHLARKEDAIAREVLAHALSELYPGSTAAVPLLSTLVDVELAAGALDDAAAAADQLAAIAEQNPSAYVRAEAAFARGRVCVASGNGDVTTCLREAVAAFTDARMPMEAERCRDAFANPAPRSDGVLTRREGEVLDLLGQGLSNPEIAERLYISRKTVEHHVSNILAKLALRSRAEAAAYSVREKLGSQ
jgi:DNA-binding CsgD family transcriptional regulator